MNKYEKIPDNAKFVPIMLSELLNISLIVVQILPDWRLHIANVRNSGYNARKFQNKKYYQTIIKFIFMFVWCLQMIILYKSAFKLI